MRNAICYNCGMSSENNNQTQGSELFDNYLSIKKKLNAKIKSVLDIMARCNSLDVTPDEAIQFVERDTTKVSSHQWRYNAGHETIYCEHNYDFRKSWSKKCTVKIPTRYLEMTDDEILKENYDVAVKALEAQREAIEARIAKALKPFNAEIAKINKQIETLKNMSVSDVREEVLYDSGRSTN